MTDDGKKKLNKTISEKFLSLEVEKDLDRLIDKIGDARYVLLGEASHGTHEYYTWRSAISKRLIREKGFSFIAVEGDWPDCYKINSYVKGYESKLGNAAKVLSQFQRWPTWMWANWEVAALAEWLHDHNMHLPAEKRVGFYGLDVYSLWESINIIIEYLLHEDPQVAQLAMETLRCFEPYQEGVAYARAVRKIESRCTGEVVKLLTEVRRRAAEYNSQREAALNAEMNALVIADAEEYYRSMVSFSDDSWNLRDSHMVSALDTLMHYHGEDAKAIIWEHNTHVGDARATDMRKAGLYNVGQLVREQHEPEDVFIAGFSSYEGSVIASRSWGAPMRHMPVPPAIPGSIEEILHSYSPKNKLLLLDDPLLRKHFDRWMGHRAIGVIYHPEQELGNYVQTWLPKRYDALLYIDQTAALNPLHMKISGGMVPETYPFGF